MSLQVCWQLGCPLLGRRGWSWLGLRLRGGSCLQLLSSTLENWRLCLLLCKLDTKSSPTAKGEPISSSIPFKESSRYQEPDLLAALNCGFIFYKSWDSSLDCMVRPSGSPLVFTEYYRWPTINLHAAIFLLMYRYVVRNGVNDK